MKIIDILNYYYSLFPVIELCVEMSGGIRGRFHIFSKEEALDFLCGWEDETAVKISFSTHYTFINEATRPMEYPHLYIMYA